MSQNSQPTWGQIARSPWMVARVGTTGAKTFRVEAIHNYTSAPTKDEIWIEVRYLGTTNSCLVSIGGGRVIYSTATWATSTVAWTGLASHVKIKLTEGVTVNRVGVYQVRLCLGKFETGKTVIYCPKVEID